MLALVDMGSACVSISSKMSTSQRQNNVSFQQSQHRRNVSGISVVVILTSLTVVAVAYTVLYHTVVLDVIQGGSKKQATKFL